MWLKLFYFILLSGCIEGEQHYRGSYTLPPCPRPEIAHGRVRYRQRRIAKFMCQDGFELVGDRYGICRNGEWVEPLPVCVQPGCPDLPVIPNMIYSVGHHGAWVVTFCLPGFKLVGPSAIYCNGIVWNSTVLPSCVSTKAMQPNLTCDFEDPGLCGWQQDERHNFDWTRINKKTPSYFFTGPPYDHTYGRNNSGYYMFIESSKRNVNDTARLLSPVYDSKNSVNACFSLFYNMYGRSVGGLRVYQKPDSLGLHTMLDMATEERENYMIFERWGNVGPLWVQGVGDLKELSEDFQIVIEGIRGTSFSSDIAIDDVALQFGDNCTAAKAAAASADREYSDDSCQGRCGETVLRMGQDCGCADSCVDPSPDCCSDYVDACVFDQESPQTAELVSETSPISISTTLASTTAKPTTTSTTTTTTTPKPTTIRTTSTTISTSTTRKATTTPRPSTTTLAPTTTKKIVTTTKLTTKVPLTTKAKATTKLVVTSTIAPKVTKTTTTKAKLTTKAETYVNDSTKGKSSTWKTAVITVVVLGLCAILLYVGIACRGARGLARLNRLRGTVTNNSEVRYLNSNDDDL